jgi:thioesterase domain-containing protein
VTYRWLVEALSVNRPIFGLQAIGLNGGQPLRSIEQMAERYLEEVHRVWPRGPYLLGGASFGGLVAFEMARRLERAGGVVPLVALFDTEYPDVPEWLPHALVVGSAPFHRFAYPQLQRARGHLRALRERGLTGYWKAVVRTSIREAVGTSTDRDGSSIGGESLPAALERVIAANDRAERDYVPLPYPGPVTLFRAGSARFSPDRRDWWRNVASVRETPVAGTHSTMRTPPHVTHLAEALRRELEHADSLGATREA